jgi:two-component system NtrC family sensor kinase
MRSKLGLKVVLALAIGLVGVFGAISYRGQYAYRQALDETNARAAERMADVIKRATHHSMLQNKRDDLYFTVGSIGAEPGLKRIRIFNSDGRISFSTDPNERGQMVDKRAEACYACHSQSEPLVKLNRPDRVRFFRDTASGPRILGLINPIENEPECSNASCHYHRPSQRVLGVLDVQLSMASADELTAAYLRRELLVDLLGIVLLLLLCAVLVWVLVHKPIRPLMEGTRRFAAGDLSYRIPVRTNDELGQLAASFNTMGTELHAAREEVARWTQTLEARVEQKTAQVQQAVQRMAEMERLASLGKLAAAVAHEINNPLSGVLTYAKLLSRAVRRQAAAAPADAGSGAEQLEEQGEWLRIIEGETLRCGALVRNLLTFARQVPMLVQEHDINVILERCVRLVQHHLQLQNIQWEWKPEGQLPILCDASRIQQALLAIIVNAIEVMPRGGFLRLKTAPEPLPGGGTAAVIRVEDTGPGIPKDVLPHIFEPFFTTKEEGKSIGMGLSVAYGIVEQHGGRIGVESEAGRGTTFIIWLPYQAPPPAGSGTDSAG